MTVPSPIGPPETAPEPGTDLAVEAEAEVVVEVGSLAASPAPSPVRTFDVLRHRNFWPYFVGNLLSSCGTWFQNIAQTLLVYRLTGSLFLVGVVNFAHFVGVFVVAPVSGVAADRVDRRRLLLATQVVATVLTAVLAAASFAGRVTTLLVIVVVLLLGLAQAFAVPSMLAFVPQLVPVSHLGPAVALNIITFNLARAVGPVLGAVVVAQFGLTAAFAINAGSFLALIAGLLAVRPRPMPVAHAAVRPRLRDSLRSLQRAPRLTILFVAGGAASMTIDPVTTLSPAYATDVYGRADTLVGWLIGAFGAGAVVAAFVVANRGIASNRRLAGLLALLGAAMAAFAVVPWFLAGMLALWVAGFAFIGCATSALARLQHSLADGEQGRMMAIWSIAFMGTRPVASLFDGFVASLSNVHVATLVLVIPVVLAIWGLLGPGGHHDAACTVSK